MTYEKYDYGPLRRYEVIWMSGQVEYIDAHQVITPQADSFSALLGSVGTATRQTPAWMMHGEVDGHWQLLQWAPAEDIRSVRNVTHTRDRAEAPDA